MKSAYTPRGDYIGSPRDARFLVHKLGIQPEKWHKKHCVCSIGYSVKDGKWYGWSHRAIVGFSVGHVIKKGSVCYSKRRGEYVIQTAAEARAAVIKFAREVS